MDTSQSAIYSLIEFPAEEVKVDARAMVRSTPGMFVGQLANSRGLHRLLFELIDNSVAEALRGHGDEILITIHDNLIATVEDRGRGIPIGVDASGKSRLEALLTTFGNPHRRHFASRRAHTLNPYAGSYTLSGLCVVNYLCARLMVEVRQQGAMWRQFFEDGKPRSRPNRVGAADYHGTRITAEAEPGIFDSKRYGSKGSRLDYEQVAARADLLAALVPGLRFVLSDKRDGRSETFLCERGLRDRLARSLESPLYDEIFEVEHIGPDGNGFQVAAGWSRGLPVGIEGIVNAHVTPQGGTHVEGLLEGIELALANWGLRNEAGRPGLQAIIALAQDDVAFGDAKRTALNSQSARHMVSAVVAQQLRDFLEARRELLFELRRQPVES